MGRSLRLRPFIKMKKNIFGILFLVCLAALSYAGPYTESGVNGYIGKEHQHANPLIMDSNTIINPIFKSWASAVINYLPSDTEWSGPWNDPNKALGEPIGDHYDIVSLGDLDSDEIAAGSPQGTITIVFADSNHITNVKGYDFAIFENGTISGYDTLNGSISGQMFSELAYVEVSSDGINYARFPSVSLTESQPGPYGTIDITNIYNLAGKHPNSYGVCTGTPFDLTELANEPNVINHLVDVNNIVYIRIVDIPGSGVFLDSENNPIYDAWVTWGSGGFDLEAVGVLKEQQYSADINLDGIVDDTDFRLFLSAWMSSFGDDNWIGRCDLALPQDNYIDFCDYSAFMSQWLKMENWRN